MTSYDKRIMKTFFLIKKIKSNGTFDEFKFKKEERRKG